MSWVQNGESERLFGYHLGRASGGREGRRVPPRFDQHGLLLRDHDQASLLVIFKVCKMKLVIPAYYRVMRIDEIFVVCYTDTSGVIITLNK